MIRLQKYISECGYTSRRKAEELIIEGRVTVNGRTASIGEKIDEIKAHVKIDNMPIKKEEKKVYIALNKPRGYISAVTDDRGRKTVMDLVSDAGVRLFPVGRLDSDSEGLLILTNDGDFTYKITHPKFKVKKTYRVVLSTDVDIEDLEELKKGVKVEDYIAKADRIHFDETNGRENTVLITISQGKNRQVRKMFEALGYEVKRLKRLSIGSLDVNGIRNGKWRYIKDKEIKDLMRERKR